MLCASSELLGQITSHEFLFSNLNVLTFHQVQTFKEVTSKIFNQMYVQGKQLHIIF